jgi:hypothetical protein
VREAVPKTILQLMNVEGMTRENVASHLQVRAACAADLPPAAWFWLQRARACAEC